ncbi:hypothetical protein JTB14_017612 [Gonioctena quinquepunctata]|nr:hypothetical protein JTB14_017612 [Gonioctena quinquepunctata]
MNGGQQNTEHTPLPQNQGYNLRRKNYIAELREEQIVNTSLIYPVILGIDFWRLVHARLDLENGKIFLNFNKSLTVPEIKTFHEFQSPDSVEVDAFDVGIAAQLYQDKGEKRFLGRVDYFPAGSAAIVVPRDSSIDRP